jgi:hypothetical protein
VWLALSGEYDTLTDYAIFALTFFYASSQASIFIFRKREPDAERPYRTWGYPVVPSAVPNRFDCANHHDDSKLTTTVSHRPRADTPGIAGLLFTVATPD